MSTFEIPFVTINIADFINSCSDNLDQSFDSLREYKALYRGRQLSVLGHNLYKEDCVDNVCLRENKNGDDPVFTLDPLDFSDSIVKYYGLNSKLSIVEQLKEKLLVLDGIESFEELERSFPHIASCYQSGLFSFANCLDSSVITYLYNCGIRTSLSYMLSEQKKLLEDLIERYETMSHNHSHFQFDLFGLKGINTDKAKLYVAYQCLKNYGGFTDQNYLINYYLRLCSFDNHSFIIADGKVISSSSLYHMYRSSIKRNSLSYLTNLDSNTDRREFYEKSGYVKRVDGLFASQYTGFFYGNGKVVCDVVSGLKGAKHSNSIFIFNISKLHSLSSLDPLFVRYDKNVRVLSHTGSWKNDVNNSISRDVSKREKEKVKELLKGVERYGKRNVSTVM